MKRGLQGFQPPVAGGSRRIEHCATLPLVQPCTSLTVNVPSSSIFEGINPGHRCTEIRSDPIPSCAEAVAVDCYKTRAITGTPARHGSETLLERLYQSSYQMRYWSAVLRAEARMRFAVTDTRISGPKGPMEARKENMWILVRVASLKAAWCVAWKRIGVFPDFCDTTWWVELLWGERSQISNQHSAFRESRCQNC